MIMNKKHIHITKDSGRILSKRYKHFNGVRKIRQFMRVCKIDAVFFRYYIEIYPR